MDLSIIIPVWNEENKIAQDIIRAFCFIESTMTEGEIIVVDDGSTDQTAEIAEEIAGEIGILRVLKFPHKGKGSAVQSGILNSRGDVIVFMDSGACVEFNNVTRGITMVENGICDIALGSRYLKESMIIKNSRIRRTISRIFRVFIKCMTIVPRNITDTQCGLKIFKGPVGRKIFKSAAIRGFMFDIETLLIALHSGYRVWEFPVHWRVDRDSRFSVLRTLPQIMKEILEVFYKVYLVPHKLKLPKK